MQLRLLDTACLAGTAGSIELPASAPSLLLAALGCAGTWVDREAAGALFWPESGHAEAHRRLRVTLHRCRQWLEQAAGLGHALQAERQRLRLSIECDVVLFRHALDAGRHAEALNLHRRPLLEGLPAADFPELDAHFAALRGALLDGRRRAALAEAGRLKAIGEWKAAVHLLTLQLDADPLAEDLLQALLRVATAGGEAASVRVTASRFVARLKAELGLEPMAQTRALIDALHTGSAAPEATLAASPRWSPQTGGPALVAGPNSLFERPEPAWSRLTNSRAGLVLVHGEPGAGKSLLLAQAWPEVARWHCDRGSRHMPLAPVTAMLARLGPVLRAAVPEPALRQQLACLAPVLADGRMPSTAKVPPGVLIELLAQVLPRCVERLVVEDLHWSDASTLQLLRRLLDDGAVRLAATVRSAHLAMLGDLLTSPRVETIALAPFDVAATGRWLEQLAGHPAPRLAAWLCRTTSGNPLLTGQLLQSLRDSGPLSTGGDHWPADLDARLDDCIRWPHPEPSAALIRHRLGALPDNERRVLRALAVWGRTDGAADAGALATLAGLSPEATADALEQVASSGWLVDRWFAHDLLHETVAADPKDHLPARMHDLAARLGAQTPGPRSDPHRAAARWWAAGNEAEAVAAELQAARQDRARGLHAAALPRLREAESRSQHPSHRAALAGLLGWVSYELGDADQAMRHAERALALAGTAEQQLELFLLTAYATMHRGQLAEAERMQALAAALDPDDAEVLTLEGHIAMLKGETARMKAAVDRLSHIASRWPIGPDRAVALISQGTSLAILGEQLQAIERTREAHAMARRCQARHVEMDAARNLVALLTDSGACDEAVAVGLQALALGPYAGMAVLKNNLGRALKRLQRWDEAQALFSELTADRDPSMRCYAWGHLIDVHGRRGAPDAVHLAIDAGLAARELTDQAPARDMVLLAVLQHGDAAALRRVERLLAAAGDAPSPTIAAALQAARARLNVAAAEPRLIPNSTSTLPASSTDDGSGTDAVLTPRR